MRRWLSAVLAILLFSSLIHADYLIMIINVNPQSMLATPGTNPGTRPPSGFPPQPPNGGPALPAALAKTLANRAVVNLIPVVVEIESSPSRALLAQYEMGRTLVPVKQKWGVSYMMRSNGPILLATFFPIPKVAERFEREQLKLAKEKANTDRTDRTLELAEWALSHGMMTQFEKVMDKLVMEDKSHATLVAYTKIKAELAKKVDKDPPGSWFGMLTTEKGYKKDYRSPHYVILHKLPDADTAEIESRAKTLEQQLRGYYYWWALRRVVLPMPQEKLPVIVTADEDEFKYFHKALSGDRIVLDGFTTSQANILVLAVLPRLEKYELLSDFSKQYWDQPGTNLNRAAYLKGKQRPNNEETLQASELALALKVIEQQREIATISHDATRQLLYASGLFPQHVHLPEWVVYGMSSVFESSQYIPWQTLGMANPHYWLILEEQKKAGLLKLDLQTLRRIVSDSYFRAVRNLPRAEQNTRQAEAMEEQAQATAWALCYTLARKDPERLQAYFKELGRMPRDLVLDEDILVACFARAFDAWDSNTNTINFAGLEKASTNLNADLHASIAEGKDLLRLVKDAVAKIEREMSKPQPNGTTPTRP